MILVSFLLKIQPLCTEIQCFLILRHVFGFMVCSKIHFSPGSRTPSWQAWRGTIQAVTMGIQGVGFRAQPSKFDIGNSLLVPSLNLFWMLGWR